MNVAFEQALLHGRFNEGDIEGETAGFLDITLERILFAGGCDVSVD